VIFYVMLLFQIFLPLLVRGQQAACFTTAGNDPLHTDLPDVVEFIEADIIGIVTQNVIQTPSSVVVDTANCEGAHLIEGQWHTVDISHIVPPDTKAVDLHVYMIVVSEQSFFGGQPEICNLLAYYKAPDAPKNHAYASQELLTLPGEALRDTSMVLVPVKDQQFLFAWERQGTGCVFRINARAARYYR
jgi:hypothetical protein